MPRPRSRPKYRHHKPSSQAVVTLTDPLGNRQDVYLGKHGTAASRREYKRVIQEWEANGRRLPGQDHVRSDITVNELLLQYIRFAEEYYQKHGRATSEVHTIKAALRPVKLLYGRTTAGSFSPRCLKAVREHFIRQPIVRKIKVRDPETGKPVLDPDTGKQVYSEKVLAQGLARRTINKHIARIKRMFAWAVEEELVEASVHAALIRVKGLRRGKTLARERKRVKPVADDVVELTLAQMHEQVADMVRLQRLTGMRPAEVCLIRPVDIDRSGKVWEYRPPVYKTEHLTDDDADRERVEFLGPKAQAILLKHLPLSVEGYYFDPRKTVETHDAQKSARRKTPRWPGHVKVHEQRKKKRQRRPDGPCYTTISYRRVIHRACKRANVPLWGPNQLRHSAGTEIRKKYGLEGSQAVLGHTELGTTQIYAEVDREAARKIMGEIG